MGGQGGWPSGIRRMVMEVWSLSCFCATISNALCVVLAFVYLMQRSLVTSSFFLAGTFFYLVGVSYFFLVNDNNNRHAK